MIKLALGLLASTVVPLQCGCQNSLPPPAWGTPQYVFAVTEYIKDHYTVPSVYCGELPSLSVGSSANCISIDSRKWTYTVTGHNTFTVVELPSP